MENIEEVLGKLEKNQEGVVLGLGAIAEVLQKMSAGIEKNEMEEEEAEKRRWEEEEEEGHKMEKAALVKDITAAVFAAMKQEMGLPVEGNDPHKVSGKDKWPMSGRTEAEDKESPAKLRTETSEVQKPIQAMEHESDEEKEEEGKKEGAEEYPMEEEKGATLKSVLKAFAELRKEHEVLKQGTEAAIKKGVESQLRKAGWREERGLAPVVSKALGATEVPIVKGNVKPEDTLEELSKLSYATLRKMQEATYGATEGIPQELIH